MTGTLALGRKTARPTTRIPSAADRISALAAGALVVAATISGAWESSALEPQSGAQAQRQESGPLRAPYGSETVIAAYAGAPYTYPSPATIGKADESITIDPVHWYTDPFKSPIYYGARTARWLGAGKAGLMVDFIHSKAIADPNAEASLTGAIAGAPLPPRARISEVVRKLEFSHGHNMLLLNGLVRLPGIGPRVSPYAGIGGGVLLPHTEVQLRIPERPRTYEYNYAGPAGQALIGVEVRLQRLSFFVEYKFTYADYEAPLSEVNGSWLFADLWRQFQRWRRGEEPPGGHITTRIASHQVVSGLAVRFAPTAP